MEIKSAQLDDFIATKVDIIEILNSQLEECNTVYMAKMDFVLRQYQQLTTRMTDYDRLLKETTHLNNKNNQFDEEQKQIGEIVAERHVTQGTLMRAVEEWNHKLHELERQGHHYHEDFQSRLEKFETTRRKVSRKVVNAVKNTSMKVLYNIGHNGTFNKKFTLLIQ